MRTLKQKHCTECAALYQPTGSCSKYCPTCRPMLTKLIAKESIRAWNIRTGRLTGEGSGGKLGTENQNYKHGRTTFRRWAKERKLLLGECESCRKDIQHATQHEWVGHHKDHNPKNNVIENLMLLCKQCHQIEHQCWKAFEGVTTISKESRADNSSKRPARENGDDIVCSA
jgi:HNH endonuclease